MSTATAGRAREYRVRDHLTRYGWVPIMRAAGSKGPADLLMAHDLHGAALIQVGTENKRLGPADRIRFTTAARLCHALPLLASASRAGIRYWHVTLDRPTTWTEYTP